MERIKNIIEFIKSKTFFKHLGMSLGSVLVFLTIVYFGLGSYTNHGETITVPSFIGQKPEMLDEFIQNKGLEYSIVDSIFDPSLPKGSVIDQEPSANNKVKKGRTVYLTINSVDPPQIKMPNLIDVSYKQAEAILQTYGLKVGNLIYKPDVAKNAVIDQLFNGQRVKAGDPILKGSIINLVLGDGRGNTEASIPNLIGRDIEEATFVLRGSGLVLGSVNYDATVKDTTIARVYKQSPEYNPDGKINQGETVDLYLTEDQGKIKP
jgi:beta-lactam-binding protein with PASTA domain